MRRVKVLWIVGMLLAALHTAAGQNRERYTPVDLSVTLKNMHLWRGLEVTPTALAAADLYYVNPARTFRAGLWGGAGFTGDFREFDYFLSYSEKGFLVELWDIYNFSPGAEYNNRQVFNYSAARTGHFIDLTVGYRLQGNFPLGVTWSTILFGRDRGRLNEKNLYSTFVRGDYPILRGYFVDLDIALAGAFALNPEKESKANFYADNGGVAEVSVTALKNFVIGNYTLPVSVTGMFNPARNYANLQVAVRIF